MDKELEAKNRLVALARAKAERKGTTLELEVEAWLARYVNAPDEVMNTQAENGDSSSWTAPRARISRAMDSISKAGSSAQSGGKSRSEAYRRLAGVISDSSKRVS